MSQSDYISSKKTRMVLRDTPDPVISSQVYTTLKSFTLEQHLSMEENRKENRKTVYNRLALPDKVFLRNIETNFPKTCEKDLRTYLSGRKTGSCQNCSLTVRNPFNEYNNKLKQMSYESPDAEIIQRYTEKEFCQCDVYFSNKK